MDQLTVKELAELKGCSVRAIQKGIASGAIIAEKMEHPQNKQPCNMIPVTSLPEDLQEKYYKKICQEAGITVTSSKPDKKAVKSPVKPVRTSIEEFSEDERAEMALWGQIIRDWQDCRAGFPGSKTEADRLFISKMKLEHPELHLTEDILYRRWKAMKEGDLQGLCENRGGANRGRSSIPQVLWDQFLYLYLSDSQPTVSRCYELTRSCAAEYYPELLPELPSERCFRRHIKSDVPEAVVTYLRLGDKAMKDKCLPYISRLYDELHANDVWIADNHTLDIESYSEQDGTVHRLYLTAFLDAKSGVLVGWNIAESASSQSTVLALRNAIQRFGVPKAVYFDNGREFLTHDIGGKGHRGRKNTDEELLPTTILQRLDITMHNAIVRNAKAKPIERTFSTVTMEFSRMFDGYCGGTIFQRPESLKRRIKEGKLPCDFEIREYIQDWIDYDYNVQEYGGAEARYHGMSRIDVWNHDIKAAGIRLAPEDELNLMLMRSTRLQKVKRNGVFVTVGKEKVWFMDERTYRYLGEEVFVRYDPAKLTEVRIYDKEDRYLFTWPCADKLLVDFITETREEIADAMSIIRRTQRFIQQEAREITDGWSNEHKLDLMEAAALKAQHGRDKFEIRIPSNVIMIGTGEVEELPAAVGDDAVTVDWDKMNASAEKRMKKWKGE